MSKYLKEFQEHSEYLSYIEGTPLLPNVSICLKEGDIYFNKTAPTPPPVAGHVLGDIAYWDGSAVAFTPYTSWESSLGTPLAVCVIPTSHAATWGDGKARFLSVRGVNEDGTASDSEVKIKWGGYGIDIPLVNYSKVPIWDNTIGGSIGSNDIGYISSDKFTGVTNVIDTVTKYYDRSTRNIIPSPYAANGSFYADYKRTIEGNNVLSDFNGKANTSAIVAALGTTSDYAARACSLYSTSGIPAGEWYLPACGELAYIMPRFNVINSALTACNGVLLGDKKFYWGSTEYDRIGNYYVDTNYGYIDYLNKGNNFYVRPFVSLS